MGGTLAAERRLQIPAIKVHQWLKGWDKIDFLEKEYRRKPEPYFFVFSLSAVQLRSLSGISRRQISNLTPRAADLGIQREHDPERSDEIARFVDFGFPWSTLSESKRRSADFHDLRKPGWLPTAIVINILRSEDKRDENKVLAKDLIKVVETTNGCRLELPYTDWSADWRPSGVPPLEVIDGQHRLWAFNERSDPTFELPVVAFHGLDTSWQAYLFWTINIKPKRINASLAFDLYPLLRSEDWLDRGEGHSVYRETRSQELTEALWSHPESPWYDRINMLGERKNPWVSQSAWVRSLMATFVKRWISKSKAGGLFGSRARNVEDEVLGWSRAQQAAFLIYSWRQLFSVIAETNQEWARSLRTRGTRDSLPNEIGDAAFYGPYSLLSTDQGVRGYLHVVNDFCFVMAPQLELRSWRLERSGAASDEDAVTTALKSLSKQKVAKFVDALAKGAETFDWRTSSMPDLSEPERRKKLVFRGGSGYKELRTQLIECLLKRPGDVGKAADRLIEMGEDG